MKTKITSLHAALCALLFVIVLPQLQAVTATWNPNPIDGDWNNNLNWTPGSAPNGPADTATFGLSNLTSLFFSASTEVNGIVFNPNASAFTIAASAPFSLTLSGAGIVNNSGVVQNFVTAVNGLGNAGAIAFGNSATAGSLTAFTNNGAIVAGAFGGATVFSNNSTAANAVIVNNAGSGGGHGGRTTFFNTSTAGSATFVSNGAAVSGVFGGIVTFVDSASGGTGTFTNNGGADSGTIGGLTDFQGSSTAGAATITSNGGTAGTDGGRTRFFDTATAGNATLIANAGTGGGGGGHIEFSGDSTGGTAQVRVFGNGSMDMSNHNAPGVTIGSLAGSGMAFLGGGKLTIGSNNLSTVFSGTIQDGARSAAPVARWRRSARVRFP